MVTPMAWSEQNAFVIEYDCDNLLNTWIPIRWVVLDKNQYEQERIEEVRNLLNYGTHYNQFPHCQKSKKSIFSKIASLFSRN